MLHERSRRAIRRLGRSSLGKHLVHAAVVENPAGPRFRDVARWPEAVGGFEDLVFLLSSNQLNHGIASLQLDEAALLYRLARDAAGPVVELGRFKGGATFLLASATAGRGEVWSYDLHVAHRPDLPGPELDRELLDGLRRYGLDGHVHLVVGDSRTAEPPPEPCGLLFVDGDHSYEGARADYLRWCPLLRPGGRVLFHDAVDAGGYGNVYPGVARLVREVERDDVELERQAGAGSIAHFVRQA